MPVYTGGQYDSPPPSPVCSEAPSLPDATSDLDMLSDCSGLSVSDEDEKRARSYTGSDIEALSDNDLEEITHSMVASADFTSSPRRASTNRREQPAHTPIYRNADQERTPSPTLNRSHRPSPLLHRGVGARDLTYPTIQQHDIDSPFGLSSLSLYRTFDEERAMLHDQDLRDYSVLDVQGESFRPRYEQASQTEMTDSSTLLNSTTTLLQVSHTTVKGTENEPYNPISETVWSQGIQEGPAAEEVAQDAAKPLYDRNAASLLTQWQRFGPRWLNRQAFGIFGVVLLSMAAYHVKPTPWVSVDTNSLFINTTIEAQVSQLSSSMAIDTAPPSKNVPSATVVDSKDIAESPTVIHDPTVPQLQPTEKPALSSFPSSVSALISMASSGIASLSTHVASASSESNNRSKDEINASIVASRRRRPKHKNDTPDINSSSKAIEVVSSRMEVPGASSHSATALSTLPKRAQRGLSTLAQRALPCPGCIATRGIGMKENKKKQASRRTGKHWMNTPGKTEARARDKLEAVGNTSIKEPSSPVIQVKGINAAFSRLTAQKFWAAVPYMSTYQAKYFQDHSARFETGKDEDPLLLETAQALHGLSFGSMCKHLDSLLLPYAQHVIDSFNAINYDTMWRWLQSTMTECYQIMAPYMQTIDAFNEKHVHQMSEDVKVAISTSIIKVDHLYYDLHGYFTRWQSAIVPLAHQYVSSAQNKVKNTKNQVENASKETVQKVYGQSKSTVKKARRNARNLLRKLPDDPTSYGKKKDERVANKVSKPFATVIPSALGMSS